MKTSNLEVTDVKIFLVKNAEGKTKALASIVLNDALRVSGLRIIEGAKGLFASLPRRKDNDGNFWNVVSPLNKDLYRTIQEEVIQRYTVAIATA